MNRDAFIGMLICTGVSFVAVVVIAVAGGLLMGFGLWPSLKISSAVCVLTIAVEHVVMIVMGGLE